VTSIACSPRHKTPALRLRRYGTSVALGADYYDLTGVTVDACRRVFVADFGNDAIEQISFNGGTYDAPVETGSRLANRWGVAVDTLGRLYPIDSNFLLEIYTMSPSDPWLLAPSDP
jgi:hypothetical protein